ncbi:MAG: hypothetical protein ACYCX0_12170, partial [Desulfurivibrionaceae bacterium]
MALSRERCGARSTPLRIASLRIFFIGRFPSIVLNFSYFHQNLRILAGRRLLSRQKSPAAQIWRAERRGCGHWPANFFF